MSVFVHSSYSHHLAANLRPRTQQRSNKGYGPVATHCTRHYSLSLLSSTPLSPRPPRVMSLDDNPMKVSIPQLGIDIEYQNWRLSIEGALMMRGLITYIQTALPADAPVTDVNKRTQAFGIILCYLSFSERLAVQQTLTSGIQDAFVLWNEIKDRHEKMDVPRVWAHWRRLNARPTATLSDRTAINTWFTDTIAAYNSYKTSGRQIDEYTACMIMLDNLPEMWDSMRRSITQAGNGSNAMTFAVLRSNMENELISRKTELQQPPTEASHALLTMHNDRSLLSHVRPCNAASS